ncbi:MAG: hypothetical protein LBB67_04275 [Oscillospiraceae bacterium]|nr:hypothetical protein [Oscillospiraceae bacterium]
MLLFAALQGFVVKPEAQDPLQVEGVPISKDLYRYFLTEALRTNTVKNTQGRPKNEKALRAAINARAVRYVAVSSELFNMGKYLQQRYKQEVAERSAYLWRIFGGYYTKIGVSKQTLTAALTAERAETQLFLQLFDTGGAREVPEAQISAYFYGNTVAYNGIRVFFSKTLDDGSEEPLSASEKEDLRKVLNEIAGKVNDGADFFTTAQEYGEELRYASPFNAVVKKGSADYSDKAFEQIRALDPQKVSVLEFDGFFLLASGLNMRTAESEYYLVYRESCLHELKDAEFETIMDKLCQSYHPAENVKAAEAIWDGWAWTTESTSPQTSTTREVTT